MNLSIILVVLGVAFSVEATPAPSAHLSSGTSIDVRDLIVAVYTPVLNIAGNLTSKTIELIDYVDDKKEEIEAKFIADLVNLTITLGDLEWKLLDAYRNNSNAAGLVILDCMEAEHNVTDAAIGNIMNQFGTCLVNGSYTLGTVKEILEEWQGFITEIQKEVTTLKNCKSLEAICLATFGANQAITYAKVTAAVAADKLKLESIAAKIGAHVLGCAVKLPLEVVGGLQGPFNDIATCIFSNK